MDRPALSQNLRRLRGDRGLSQVELAARAGLSAAGYRRIERGETWPRSDNLQALALALEARPEELLRPVRTLARVRFRSLKRLKSRAQVLAKVSRILEDTEDLERLLDQPFRSRIDSLAKAIGELGSASAAEAAALCRRRFRLDPDEPIHDLAGLLESKGVRVVHVRVQNDAFSGLSVGTEEGGPAVVVNTWERIPVEDWIFSAARELAHLLLHPDAYEVALVDEDETEEREANEFASHFLMPEQAFRREWEASKGFPLIERVFKVKRIYRVSWRTVLYRVQQQIPKDQHPLLWRRFQVECKQRWNEPGAVAEHVYDSSWAEPQKRSEPDEISEVDFAPPHLRGLVRDALDQQLITLTRAAEILSIDLGSMRELARDWIA